MFRLAALVLSCASLLAQNITAKYDEQLGRAARNPHDLARYIDSHKGFDWAPMWKALGHEPLFMQPCGSLTGGMHQCSTELITITNPDQTILLIQGDVTPSDIYLRFWQTKPGEWRFGGAYEAMIHNHPRRHEIDRSSGKPFLRISSQGVHGSDMDSEIENWFDLTRPLFTPVFGFPVRGYQHRLAFGISREITSAIMIDRDKVLVTLEVRFLAGERNLTWRSYSAQYVLKPNSEASFESASISPVGPAAVTKAAFETLADMGEDSANEDFVRYTMPELRSLALGRDSSAKEWLKTFLSYAKDTPETRELKVLLH